MVRDSVAERIAAGVCEAAMTFDWPQNNQALA
jgi:hypothetical protein